MSRTSSLPPKTSFDTIEVGSKRPSSTPGCVTGLKRFIERLLHRRASRTPPRREEPGSSPPRRWRSRWPQRSGLAASSPPRSPLPAPPPDINRRHVMATRLEDLIQANAGLRLGLNGIPPSMYHRALGSLFTNNWDRTWETRGHGASRCFPEDSEIEATLEAMSTGAMPALFVLPRPQARYWDCSLPTADVTKLLSIDTDALVWPLQLASDALERAGSARDRHGDRISRHALRRPLDAIRIVQSMLRDKPDLSLRELLTRYPARVAEWRAARPRNTVPDADWELTDLADASLHGKQADAAAWLRELQAHAESTTLPERADGPMATIATQGLHWLNAADPSARATRSARLMGLCQAELDRTAGLVDSLSPGDEARVHRRLRLLSMLMVYVRHHEGMAFSLEPVVEPASPTARSDSPIQKDRPGAGS